MKSSHAASASESLPNATRNALRPEDRAVHNWYRFVLSYPPHLVRDYLARFGADPSHVVLDPFCGTGTTLVECAKSGIASVGIEANPMAWFAGRVKTAPAPDPAGLLAHARKIARRTERRLAKEGFGEGAASVSLKTSGAPAAAASDVPLLDLNAEQHKLILKNSISPIPLHRTLALLESMRETRDERYHAHELLALASALVNEIGNLHFGPEVGVGKIKPDAPVVSAWLARVEAMCADLKTLNNWPAAPADLHHADSRAFPPGLPQRGIDFVITSPPYPNEKDYTRTTRLESVLLGFISTKAELRALKQGLVRSNTRNVYKADEDDSWLDAVPEIHELADRIERRRIEMGKTSGFERLYHRVTRLYFGGMARHLGGLRPYLKPGARLAYVVGDQASYLRVMIRTGGLLSRLAETLGYETESIDLFRTRLATATREPLNEEVVVLRWTA